MLVLTRKKDEMIHIGDGIRVTVISVRGDRVRLGFEAPPEVRILRTELQDCPGLANRPVMAPHACISRS